MPRQRVTISARDYAAVADLIRQHRVAVIRQTAKASPDGGYRVQALVESGAIEALRAAGYGIDVHEDAEGAGRERQDEFRVARAARAGVAARVPAPHYLDVDEVEARLASCAAAHPAVTELLKLPHKTWEGRRCRALRIGGGAEGTRIATYFLGGIHAREWGSPDILIAFAERLTAAYHGKTGVALGTRRFTAAQIKKIVETKHVYVLPQANPDGRHYSMTVDATWRKNRRPAAASGPTAGCGGVDLNRNYDFLWNFPKYFDPRAPVANSTDPCDPEVYIGPAPASEPETRNVLWLLNRNPRIRYLVDIHSFGELILYNWGDDQDQATAPDMNFLNPAYDGKRGRADDAAYREYLPEADRRIAVGLATKMRAAIAAVRGRAYRVAQSMTLYPTAGTSDDYVFSRHRVDPGKPKTYGFTIEWGSEANATPFHPPYHEMAQIIDEVTAGLLEFCRVAV
jgi:carboxypeptidase T